LFLKANLDWGVLNHDNSFSSDVEGVIFLEVNRLDDVSDHVLHELFFELLTVIDSYFLESTLDHDDQVGSDPSGVTDDFKEHPGKHSTLEFMELRLGTFVIKEDGRFWKLCDLSL
jgi:hypothetical protein